MGELQRQGDFMHQTQEEEEHFWASQEFRLFPSLWAFTRSQQGLKNEFVKDWKDWSKGKWN